MFESADLYVAHLLDTPEQQRQINWHDRLAKLREERMVHLMLPLESLCEFRPFIGQERLAFLQLREPVARRPWALGNGDGHRALDELNRLPAQRCLAYFDRVTRFKFVRHRHTLWFGQTLVVQVSAKG